MTVNLTPDEVTRFRSKITYDDECWLWTGETNNQGYGRFPIWREGGRSRIRLLAHRVAFTLGSGWTPEGVVVRHTCDSPPCVRGDHLIAGTQGDNIRDAMVRGRADLTGLEQYRAIRDALAYGRVALDLKQCSRCDMVKSLS